MATKVTYPNTTVPAAPAGAATVVYPNAADAGIPAADPGDRLGGDAMAASSPTAARSSFVANPMPQVTPTGEERAFADHVLAVRSKLTAACAGVPVEVAAVALMAAALSVVGENVPDSELRARLEATARDYTNDQTAGTPA